MTERNEAMERATQALIAEHDSLWPDGWLASDEAEKLARSVMAAVREPTGAMRLAGAHVKAIRAANRLIKPGVSEVFQAMIDEVLRP